MKVVTFIGPSKADTSIKRVRHCVCHCGVCPATHAYEGAPIDAINAVRGVGWTVNKSTGLARCKTCTAVFGHQIYDALKHVNGGN